MFIAVFCLFALVSQVFASSSNIVIKGSTTVLPITQALVEAFVTANKGVNISVSGAGSGDGIKAIIDGTTDIAQSSRPMTEKEIALLRTKGGEVVEYIVGLDALTPVVHPSNGVVNLSLDQLNQIYQGKIRNWQEVGGVDRPIVVVSRDTSSGTFESWHHFVMRGSKVTPRAQMLASSGAVYAAVSKNPNAIGYIGMGYVKDGVKAVSVDGVVASLANVQAKKFPIARELYFYTNGAPQGMVAQFMQFALGKEGQRIVAREGFIPVLK
ncbi:MAG: PstS family phosphate ABC transporter substrate-binding protein [Deltaproteobacteria bacterium]|nr:PstS family phosphate ABC transporter substrate-binding protein [Deltaproteobacteria bacterium]